MLRALLLTSLLLCSIFIYAQDFASIQSNLSNYAKRVYFIEKFNAKKVEDGFSYNSGDNTEWESVESLRRLIKENLYSDFQ